MHTLKNEFSFYPFASLRDMQQYNANHGAERLKDPTISQKQKEEIIYRQKLYAQSGIVPAAN